MNDLVRSVERALAILGCFGAEHPQLGISDIAEQLHLPRSTVHRILTTLEAWGYIQQDESSSKYQLGLKLFEMGTLVRATSSLRHAALPVLEQLVQETKEAALLTVYDNGDVLYLEVREYPQPVKIAANPGDRLPAYCTASGKALLSVLPPEEVERVLARPLIRRTPKTITDPDQLRHELALIRQRGYSISDEEHGVGVRGVAAPILTREGNGLGAVAIVGPVIRLSDPVMQHFAHLIVAAARRISERIQGRNPQ